jgi:ureidoglycolate lyase
MARESFEVPVVPATRDNTAKYGVFIGTDVPVAGLGIPFYEGAVEEGPNLPFECHGAAVVRTARIHPRPGDVVWLERHGRLTQLFLGLGDVPMAMVLGQPTDGPMPELASVVAFVFPPGHGIMIHKGTWHDFPLALHRPVTVLVLNSAEVVEALASQKTPAEMDRGDVYKIAVANRLGRAVRVTL